MLKEFRSRLKIGLLKTIAIVLDASGSAQECWENIIRMALDLHLSLPGDTEKNLFILSDSKEYDFASLGKNAAKWHRENNLRGSFITPILEKLTSNTDGIVIIGSGRIYDLEDWQDSEFASGFLFVNLGESLRGDLNIGEEISNPSSAELVSRLYNPISSVTISGKGFMPYYWSNPGYKLTMGDEIVLTGQNLADFSISLAFFGQNAQACLKRAEDEEQIPLQDSEIEVEDDWELLSEEESKIFHLAIRGESIVCHKCGNTLPASALRCYGGGSILGEPVYPSFGKRRGFVIFREKFGKTYYKFNAAEVIRIGKMRVARVTGSSAKVYEYETSLGKWVEKGELEPYYVFDNQWLSVV